MLVVLGAAVLWPSIGFDFVNWDDPAYIEHNDLIKGWSLQNLKGICTEVVTRNYAPLTIFSFLIDHTLWGLDPPGYHATNIVLHLVNGVLVFLLLRSLTGSTFVAWSAAAAFLVHPVQLESVVWVSSRKGLLASLFMLWALLIRLRPETGAKQDAWYCVLLFAALLAKAHAVVLPAIVLVYDVVVRREKLAAALPRQVIPGFVSLLLLLLTMGAQNTVLGGVRQHMSLSTPQILAVDVTILWMYAKMLVWPTDLCVMYDPPTSGIWLSVLCGTAGWVVAGRWLWAARYARPLWLFGAASILLLLFPMLNFFRITTLMNDRYLYLPCIVVFAMIAGCLEFIARRVDSSEVWALRIRHACKWSLAGCGLAACVLLTSRHMPVWKNAESLWTHALSCYPDMPVLRIQMAVTEYDSGRVRDAVARMSRALIETQPDELDRERMQEFVKTWTEELNQGSRTAAVSDRESRHLE